MATKNALRISAHSSQCASLSKSIIERQIPVKTLSKARPSMPSANHQAAPLRRLRNTAATAKAALNVAAIKAKVGSDVTADGLSDRAIKSFPAHPTKVSRQF